MQKKNKMRKHVLRYNIIFLSAIIIVFIVASVIPYATLTSRLTDQDKKVAAFYYGWYSNTTDYSQTVPYDITDDSEWRHWNAEGFVPPNNACSTFKPELGYYDSADPDIIEEHLLQAEWCGLDAFICSYWGNSDLTMDNFANMINVAENINSNLSFSLYFEIAMSGLDQMNNEDAETFLTNELQLIYQNFTSPEFEDYIWKENNKPVLFVYVVQFVDAIVWQNSLANIKDLGCEFYLVADRPGRKSAYNQNFQAAHQYDVYEPSYKDTYIQTFSNLKVNCKEYDQLFIAGVSPGYDDHLVRDGNPALTRNNGETYKTCWENAISLNPDWITITSWNEWHEGTEIEPSIENSDLALNQTKSCISEFKSGTYVILTPTAFYVSLIQLGIIAVAVSIALVVILQFVPDLFSSFLPKKLRLTVGILSIIASWGLILAYLIIEVILGDFLEFTGSGGVLVLPVLIILHDLGIRALINKEKSVVL